MEQQILKRTVRRYVIAWYNGLGGRPDYSTRSFDTIEEAQAAAETAREDGGRRISYRIVDSVTHRKAA